MKAIALLFAVALVACAAEPDDSARGQTLCTEGDPDCGDPGGGGPPSYPPDIGESYSEGWTRAHVNSVGVGRAGCRVISNWALGFTAECSVQVEVLGYIVIVDCVIGWRYNDRSNQWEVDPSVTSCSVGGGQSPT